MQFMAKTCGALALMIVATSVTAQDLAAMDTNGDGALSYPEMVVGYPDLTEDGFTAMDTSGDGVLDADEIAAAIDSGMIMPSEG